MSSFTADFAASAGLGRGQSNLVLVVVLVLDLDFRGSVGRSPRVSAERSELVPPAAPTTAPIEDEDDDEYDYLPLLRSYVAR